MTKQEISDLLYSELCYMYCNNCRCNSELSPEDINYGCEDCYRKYNGWGISRATCDALANKILNN